MGWVDGAVGLLLGSTLLSAALVGPPAVRAADQCVACHTDAAKLKVHIHAPGEIAEEEGEG